MISTKASSVYHYLKVIKGPMFSGKTMQLGTELSVISYSDAKIMLILHESDTRFGESNDLITHNGVQFKIKTHNLTVKRLGSLRQLKESDFNTEQYVFLDETHFFPLDECAYLTELFVKIKFNLTIVVLSNTCFLKPKHKGTYLFTAIDFPQMSYFMAICTHVINLVTICSDCKNIHFNAVFSYAHDLSDVSACEKNGTVVGGVEKYKSLCFSCYIDRVRKYGLPCINDDGSISRLFIDENNIITDSKHSDTK